MEFFCYHRDRPGSEPLRGELLEEHWDLPDPAAARAFAFDEPNYHGPADLTPPSNRDDLIAYGPLLSDDASTWLGTAMLVRATDPNTARATLTPHHYADIEVHNWQFGGRPT